MLLGLYATKMSFELLTFPGLREIINPTCHACITSFQNESIYKTRLLSDACIVNMKHVHFLARSRSHVSVPFRLIFVVKNETG